MQNYEIKQRNIAVSILLTILTCGLYGIYWFVCITDDMGKLSNDSRLDGGKCLLYTILTCGIYGIYWAYLMGKNIYNLKLKKNPQLQDYYSILFLILDITQLSIIIYIITQDEINNMISEN